MKVSIISVNYNGRHLLRNFLESIDKLNYPKDKIETIIVDNGSKDDSINFVKRKYDWVKIIKLEKNLGFGRANNIGITNSNGELLLLVNNDTKLEVDSVNIMVDCYKRWSLKAKVGAVSAKLVLFDRYLNLKVNNAFFHDYTVPDSILPVNPKLYILKSFNEKLHSEDVYIPIANEMSSDLQMKIILKKRNTSNYLLMMGNKLLSRGSMKKGEDFKKIELKLTKEEVEKRSLNLVQNAGTYLFRDGYGRDRGTMIVGGKEYYEKDLGQYDKEEMLQAFCGAGVMLSRKAIEDVGGFDPLFFMYYEDDDLSFRLKEKGWNLVFCPKARIRHIHAASSVEWSKNFVFNVEKNRMLFVAKHWPRKIVLWEWIKYIVLDTLGALIYHVLYGEFRQALGKFKLRLKVNLSLLPLIPYYLLRTERMNDAQIKKFK